MALSYSPNFDPNRFVEGMEQFAPSGPMEIPQANASQLQPYTQAQQPVVAPPPTLPQIEQNPEIDYLKRVYDQFMDNRQQKTGNAGLVEAILGKRFQPTAQDTSTALLREVQSFAPAAGGFKPYTGQDIATQRALGELSPYTTAIELQKKAREARGMGGATGELVQAVMNENPGMSFTDALYRVQTGWRQGTQLDPAGNVMMMPGAAGARGQLSYGEASGRQQAELQYAAPIAGAKETGKATGEKTALLTSMASKMPELMATVDRLSELGKTATYTQAGQLRNTMAREAGLPVPQSGVDRAEYISIVDNQILPLLTDTFGAQFTVAEGDSLRATLGRPDLSPTEKDAILRAFIKQKMATLESLGREVGVDMSGVAGQPVPPGKVFRYNQQTGQLE